MAFSPHRNLPNRWRRSILKCESMEERALPGDGFWSFSFAPIEALLDFVAVVADQVMPTIGSSDVALRVEPSSTDGFDLGRGDEFGTKRTENESASTFDLNGNDRDASATGKAFSSEENGTGLSLASSSTSAFAAMYLTDLQGTSSGQPFASSASDSRVAATPAAAQVSSSFGSITVNAGSDSTGMLSSVTATGGLFAAGSGSSAGAGDAVPMRHDPPPSPPPPATTPQGYSPAQIRHAYGLDSLPYDGAGLTIAIVDAYNAPNIISDANVFSKQFSLPQFNVSGGPTLKVVNQSGGTSLPFTDAGWALEISLDVEWAHAIAPKANILLVESTNASSTSIYSAINYAASQSHIVSMSFGLNEYSGETSSDSMFNKAGVAFTAASGDSGTGVIYPAASPYVLSVGGTSLQLDSLGNRISAETAWNGSGGGISQYEAKPTYQSGFGTLSTAKRGTPDVSWIADPNTGFAVYDSTAYQGLKGWSVVGGTSAGAPQWAGLIALTDQGRLAAGKGYLSTSNLSSSLVYAAGASSTYTSNYFDITSGSNGSGAVAQTTTGYDYVTGLGSPRGTSLVPFLINN